MADVEEQAAVPLARTPAPRWTGRRWLVLGGIAFALMLTLGGVLVTGQARAASSARLGSVDVRRLPTMMPTMMPGQCDGQLTVSNVTNRTITVTGTNGNTATIYVTSHTQYVKGGQVVAASAVQVGSRIYVVGTCGDQGRRISATRVEIVG